MELVDKLSLDERFAGLFETARQISKARADNPRVTMDDEVTEAVHKPKPQSDDPNQDIDSFDLDNLFVPDSKKTRPTSVISFDKPPTFTEYTKDLDSIDLNLDYKKIIESLIKQSKNPKRTD